MVISSFNHVDHVGGSGEERWRSAEALDGEEGEEKAQRLCVGARAEGGSKAAGARVLREWSFGAKKQGLCPT